MTRRFLPLLLVAGLAACGPSKQNSSWSTAKPGDPILPALPPAIKAAPGLDAATTAALSAPAVETSGPTQGKGIGPVDHVDIALLKDDARAAAGAQLFQTKCSACHKIAERYIGPALGGVTARREPEWILNMILNPENMLQQDPTAKALLAEYIAPMANQHLTRDEAESVLAYFLQQDAPPAASAEAPAPAGTEPDKTVDKQ
jgi:mono/diheme cytochrome c family protein